MPDKSFSKSDLLTAMLAFFALGVSYIPVSPELAIVFHLIAVGVCLKLLLKTELPSLQKALIAVAILGLVGYALAQRLAQESRRALFAEGLCPFLARPMTEVEYARFKGAVAQVEAKAGKTHLALRTSADEPAPEARALLTQVWEAFHAAGWSNMDMGHETGTGHGVYLLAYDLKAPVVGWVHNAFQAAGIGAYEQSKERPAGATGVGLEIRIGEPPAN